MFAKAASYSTRDHRPVRLVYGRKWQLRNVTVALAYYESTL